MLNNPTIRQHFVHQAVQPVRNLFPQSVIYHYMDDILIAAPSQDILTKTISFLKNSVASAGLVIAFKKKKSTIQSLGNIKVIFFIIGQFGLKSFKLIYPRI